MFALTLATIVTEIVFHATGAFHGRPGPGAIVAFLSLGYPAGNYTKGCCVWVEQQAHTSCHGKLLCNLKQEGLPNVNINAHERNC